MRRTTVPATGARSCRTRLAAAGSAIAVAAATVAGLTVTLAGPASAASGLTANWYESAPYYYTLDAAAPDLGQVMSATGEKAFELAFILAPNGGGCTPTWDGTDTVSSDTQVAAVISEVRADGGDVSVSAGGYGGTKLGQECGTASATAAAYQSVISKYALHAIDFDLEEPEIENAAAIADELGAAQILQTNNPGLLVSVTIPTATSGANYFGQLLLNQAKSDGFVPADFSLMPFDGGFAGAAAQQTALTDFNAQLVATFGWSSAVAWNHEGISQMNGQTDTGEHFAQTDFAGNLSFAESHNMSRYTFWDVNRDVECNPPNNNGKLSGDCSSVTQNNFDFTKYDTQFATWAPTTLPPVPPQPACVSAQFSATQVYTQGMEVSYGGHNWTAAYWTQGGTPPTDSGAWVDDGPCGGSGSSASASPSHSASASASPSASASASPSASAPPSASASASASASPTGTSSGGNLVANGSFSTGALSPWTCDSGTATVVSSPTAAGAAHALQGTPTSSDDAQCSQVISVAPSHTYTLSGQLDGSYVYLGVSGTGTTDTSTWTPGTSGFQTLSVSFTTGASTKSVTVYVHGWYAEPVYYADGISVQ